METAIAVKDALVSVLTVPLSVASDIVGQATAHVAANAPVVIDTAVNAINTLTHVAGTAA